MSLIDYARTELEAIGAFTRKGDFYGGMTGNAVMELVACFAKQGHSGMSAGIVRQLFDKLARWEPLSPLTGADDEWHECGDGVFQNRRCSRVFKDREGNTYDIDGRVFREPNGSCWTSRESRVPVTFPYTPTTVYVDVPAPEARP